MKQKKRYEDDLRGDLIRLNLYHEKNERLIKCAALAQWFVEMMEEELRRTSFTLRQTGSQGQTKIMQHPHVESIRKYNQQLAYCYARLGLGNEEQMNDIQDNELEQFLREIEN